MSASKVLVFVVFALTAAACGGGVATTTLPAESSTTAAPPTTLVTTTEAPASGAGSSREGVKKAVVRIVAEGSFVDAEFGAQYNTAGVGSGFIIDPSGLAVTNNHVVTGAAFLQVYVGGEDEPRNARVLGVSECSDLAVIDIDGDGYAFLDWYDGEVNAGMKIYAIGFPLGTEEYTILDGIVSKEKAGGETSWASVDHVIEHSADVLPGNSGGPVVTDGGKVLAITYAGDSAGQSFAIDQAEAQRVLDRLIAGEDVTSLGINGQAFVGDGYSGIWVASVESGSPAQRAGIRGGDILTTLEGLVLATDGTMADYCDILRSRTATDPMTVEVYRPATDEYLTGTLNTDEPLEVAFSFQDELGSEVADTGTTYTDYVTIYDDTNSLSVDVPVEWSDIFSGSWILADQDVGYTLIASPSLDGFFNTWDTPGIFFGASSSIVSALSEDDLLDLHTLYDSCTSTGRDDYDDGLYTGRMEVWENCGGTDTIIVNIAATPQDRAFMMLVQMQVVTDADLDALDRAISSFVASP
jgi:serine protease Do